MRYAVYFSFGGMGNVYTAEPKAVEEMITQVRQVGPNHTAFRLEHTEGVTLVLLAPGMIIDYHEIVEDDAKVLHFPGGDNAA